MIGPLEIISIILGIGVLFGLFLLFRQVALWYYKINRRIELLEDIKAYLMFMAKQTDAEKFDAFNKKWEELKRNKPQK